MERRSEEYGEAAPQTIKGRVLSAVASARTTAAQAAQNTATQAANATAIARNPLGMALGSVAAGFLAGMLLPITAFERERMGLLGERLTDNAKDVAANAIEESKAAVSMVIEDAISRAGENMGH